jgi:hypothetical protein
MSAVLQVRNCDYDDDNDDDGDDDDGNCDDIDYNDDDDDACEFKMGHITVTTTIITIIIIQEKSICTLVRR